jgi:uncharacterized membrane protein YeaQ/YmgE (transglycosylase-associated protein family)
MVVFIVVLLVGLFVGLIARLLVPGRDNIVLLRLTGTERGRRRRI